MNNSLEQFILNFIETGNNDNYLETLPKLSLVLKTKYNILDFDAKKDIKINLDNVKGTKQNINKVIVKQLSEIIIKEKIKQLKKELLNLKNG
jgi:hypothetical protein